MIDHWETNEQKIAAGLAVLRKRQKHCWFTFFLGMPFMVIVFVLDIVFLGDESIAFFVLIVFVAIWVSLALKLNYSRCPRCWEIFFTRQGKVNHFTEKCLHCGQSLQVVNHRETTAL